VNLATCQCGQVTMALSGAPFLSAICCCESCRAAGLAFAEQAPDAPSVVDPDGGTAYGLYRKDRARIVSGSEHLDARRLTPTSPTRRMVAACCGTPMFLDFTPGHWLSVYRDRIPDPPPLEMQVMTGDLPAGTRPSGALPSYPGRPGKFLFRILAAWAAMGFRRRGVAGSQRFIAS
jgi:hypothetical protein